MKSADLPTDPVEPRPLRTVMLAAFVGLLLGLAAAFLVDYLDDSVRTADDLEALTDAPVLAVVPVEPPPDNRPIALSEPHEFAVEIYRGLRTNVQFLGLDRPLRVIQVTSSLPGEGKTTTATNLAVVLAQAGQPHLARRRRPPQAADPRGLRGAAVAGFTELLLGEDVRDGRPRRRGRTARRHRRRRAAEPERDAVDATCRGDLRRCWRPSTTT